MSKPLSLLLDDHGYLVTVSQGNKSIVRYYPNHLTTIDQPSSPLSFDTPITLAHHDGAYYVGFDNSYILVVDSNNLTQIHNISTPFLNGARDMIFLNDAVWSATLVVNASLVAPTSDGAHITIDDCDRYWFSLGTYGVQVFDKQGSPLGSLYPRGTNVFDTLMLDNYVIYQSDLASNRIIRTSNADSSRNNVLFVLCNRYSNNTSVSHSVFKSA